MPVKEVGPHFEFVSWRVPQFQRSIEYPSEVMEEIRAFSCDELLQLSHGGDEVGGILFGTRREDLIRILTWRPIACEHSQGQVLRLSHKDRLNLAVQLEVARQNPDLKDLRPVGWFVSHLREGVSLVASDLEIYNGFFPEAWQVALVIGPKSSGRAQAGFFVREADGKLQSEASYQSFDLAPLHPPTAAIKFAAAPPPEASPPEPPPSTKPKEPEEPAAADLPQTPPPSLPEAPPLQTQAFQASTFPASALKARPLQAKPFEPPAFEPPTFQAPALHTPSFQVEEPLPSRDRWFWAVPILLALGIAAFMLYQRQVPSSNAAIALHVSNEGQTAQLAWDANSRAIRDSFRGEITIDDGGKSSQISLTSDQLHAGKLSYVPQSGDVGFAMTVYPATGDPIHDSTRLIAPVLNPATQPPQLLPENPVPATPPAATSGAPPAADQSALQQQVERLKDALGKERARADELQNLVRILENRLGIKPEPPKSAPRP